MRIAFLLAATALAATALHQPATADDKCDPATMSSTIEQRMQAENKTPADIADVVQSRFKRKILEGRIKDASDCPSDAVSSAVDLLAQKYK